VAFEGDGDPDGDAEGETGAFGVDPVAEGDADGDPVFDADGEAEGVERAGREDQLTPIAWCAAPTGSIYTAAVPPVPLTRRTVTTTVVLCCAWSVPWYLLSVSCFEVVVADQSTGPPRTVTEIVPTEPVPRDRRPDATVRLPVPPSPAPAGPAGAGADDHTGLGSGLFVGPA
jgi:hypothetical protein